MVRLERVRSIVVVATIVVILVGLAESLVNSNPERLKHQRTITQLDMLLLQKRAIAANPGGYRAKVEELKARLAEVDHLLSPDLEALGQVLRERGAELVVAAPVVKGFWLSISFRVRGTTPQSAEGAFAGFDETGHLFDYSKFEMSAERWTLSGQAFEFNLGRDRPVVRSKAKRAPPWYDTFNEDQRGRIKEKRAELRRLDKEIGELGAFISLKKELEDKLPIVERLRGGVRDVRPCARLLALPEHPPLSNVVLSARAGIVRGSGDLAGDVDEARLRALLPDGFRLTQFVPGPGRKVTISVVPQE